MLGYGSYEDIKTREVYDALWVIFGTLGLLINIYEIYLGRIEIIEIVIPLLFIGIIGFLMNYFHLFGEADILAFVTTVFIQPQPPDFLIKSLGWRPPFYAFTILSNSALIGVLSSFLIFFRNIHLIIKGESIFFSPNKTNFLGKIVLLFSGSSVLPKDVKGPPFEYPLELPGASNELRLRPDFSNDDEAEAVFNHFRDTGNRRIWVSTTLPYIAIIFVGYLFSIFFGDIIMLFFMSIM
jgi:hypothetical protein